MTVWLSSPGGGGTIPGFCRRKGKGSDTFAIFTIDLNHKKHFEVSQERDSMACMPLLGQVT